MTVAPQLHAIIPAGGAGTRLWPLSRVAHPKFLLPLDQIDRSLIQATVDRLEPLARTITVVTGQAHEEAVHTQLADYTNIRIVCEPSGRDSMPAIGIASELIRAEFGPDAIVGSFAADHVITDAALFRDHVQRAMIAAARGYITTLGIEPSHPSTAFGYIKPGDSLAEGVYVTEEFVEKPDAGRADIFVADGYMWNAGIFIMRTGTLHRAIATYQPHLADRLPPLAQQWHELEDDERARRWAKLTPIAFDYAVAEPAAHDGKVAVVAASAQIGWSDLGDFLALSDSGGGAYALETPIAVEADAPRAFGDGSAPPIAVVGIDDCIVVYTDDAILVTTADATQKVKEIPSRLKEYGLDDLL